MLSLFPAWIFASPDRHTWALSGLALLLLAGSTHAQQPVPPAAPSNEQQTQGRPATSIDPLTRRLVEQYARTQPQFTPAPSTTPAPAQNEPAFSVIDMMRNRTDNPPVCAIPLLPTKVDRSSTYAIRQVTPPEMDDAIVAKPVAPACPDRSTTAPVLKPRP
jgi:hypothetical protein